MTSGKLGKAYLAANRWEKLYTVPTDHEAVFNINAVNTSDNQTRVHLAITDSGQTTITPVDYIEYNQLLPAYGVLERTGIVCRSGESVYVSADNAGVVVRVHGFEDTV